MWTGHTRCRDYPNLGRYSASRRVARTIYLGSAPTLNAANKGLDDRHIKLGCARPGESVATFGDALHRLTDQATYLYLDGQRYWDSTQPSVTRLARDRAAQLDEHTVLAEIERRLRAEQRTRGDFARVHACPASAGNIPDECEARLAILRPCYPHAARDQNSPVRAEVATILDQRGTGSMLSGERLSPGATPPATATLPRCFYSSVSLDPLRMGWDAGQTAEEVVQHLSALLGAHVAITLEIRAEIPDGVPESTVRTVLENCRTLRFTSFTFDR